MKVNIQYWNIVKDLILKEHLEYIDVDWRQFHDFLIQHKIYLLIYNKIKNMVPVTYKSLYKNSYNEKILRIKKQINFSKLLLTKFKDRKFIINKGFLLSKYIYNDPFIRMCSDIDIFCDDENIIPICNLMEDICQERKLRLYNYTREEKNLFYISEFEKVYHIDDDIAVEIKTTANGIDNLSIAKMIKNKEFMRLDEIDYPILNQADDYFLRFVDNIGENTNIKNAIFFKWKIRDIIDFYYCIKNNFTKIISIDFLDIDKRILFRLKKLLYFVSKLIDKNIVSEFCEKTNITLSNSEFEYLGNDIVKLFLDKSFLNKYFTKQEKENLLLNQNLKELNNRRLYQDNYFFNESFWLEPLLTSKLNFSPLYGVNEDDNYIYFNLSIFPIKNYMIRLRILDTNLNHENLFYDLKFKYKENKFTLYQNEQNFDLSFIDLDYYIKEERIYFIIKINKTDDILFFSDTKEQNLFFNLFIYMENKTNTFFIAKNINYNNYVRIRNNWSGI